jgi:uncharacterized protein YprB with RNaseH-like and TPR domain
MSDVADRFRKYMGSQAGRADGRRSMGEGPSGAAGGERPWPTEDRCQGNALPPGALVATPHGQVRVIEREIPTALPYAVRAMDKLLPRDLTTRASYLKDERLRNFRREEALFLDVETTGLSHGAGTIAFLVGLGVFEGDRFRIRQILLDDYDQEQAQLHLLLEWLDRKAFLVSYNGKSFDTSVLENRLVIQRFMDRRNAHLRLVPHLDLLHLGRRIYSGTLENHTLGTMEKRVLGFDRGADIPGELVPQYYFQYLLTGDGAVIEPVLKHNFDDVLSLVHLAHLLFEKIDPRRPAGDARIDFNLGKLFFDSGFPAEAVLHLEAAMQDPSAPQLLPAARLLARAYRQLGRPWEDALLLWQRVAASWPNAQAEAALPQAGASPAGAEAWVEQSVLHERKGRDLEAALRCALQARSLLPADERIRSRVERLEARLRRHRPAST